MAKNSFVAEVTFNRFNSLRGIDLLKQFCDIKRYTRVTFVDKFISVDSCQPWQSNLTKIIFN